MTSGDKYRCPVCRRDVGMTQTTKFRKHNKEDGTECDMSGEFVPGHIVQAGPSDSSDVPVKGRDYGECPACGRTPKLDKAGAYGLHRIVSGGTENCPMSGKPYRPAGQPTDEMTSAESIARGEDIEQWRERRNARIGTKSPELTSTLQASQPQPSPDFRQPDPPFVQPGRITRVLAQAVPMTDRGREIAARLKETFHAYSNRLERNTQTTLGPSEIGTPCDRRIALSLLRVPPVNPGGDGWASFIGTCVHGGLARMFTWADAGTGRYAVEAPLSFPNAYVPKGTGDLLDRVLLMFLDHKLMGRWSLDKLSTRGPIPTYRVQVHTYAYGARLKGKRSITSQSSVGPARRAHLMTFTCGRNPMTPRWQ